MPRFFNRIRKQLAKENIFFQYSGNAIGEILPVVVRILIALRVNNENAARKEISFLYDNTYPWTEDWFVFLKGNSYRLLTENMVMKFYGLKALDSYKPRNYKSLQDDEEFQSNVQ